jgi:hypothetical protein
VAIIEDMKDFAQHESMKKGKRKKIFNCIIVESTKKVLGI